MSQSQSEDTLGAVAKSKTIQGNPFPIIENGNLRIVKLSRDAIIAMERRIAHLCESEINGDIKIGPPGGPGILLPKYGEYSVLMRRMTHVVYDAPELLQMIGHTAATDFHRIWWAAPFVYRLTQLDESGANALLFVALHEVGHILLDHNKRLKNTGMPFEYEAVEIENNSKLVTFYSEANPGKEIASGGIGIVDSEKWVSMAAEEIQQVLIAEDALKPKPPPQQQNQGQQGQGAPSPGKGQSQKGEAGKNAPQQGQGGQSDPSDSQQAESGAGGDPSEQQAADTDPNSGGGGKGNNQKTEINTAPEGASQSELNKHNKKEAEKAIDDFLAPGAHNDRLTEEQVADYLHNNGFSKSADVLGVPKPKDKGQLEINRRLSEGARMSAVKEGQEMRRKAEQQGGKMPGSHMDDYLREEIRALRSGRMTWKMALRNLIVGRGMTTSYTERRSSQLYHVDPSIMGVTDRIRLGVHMPSRPSVRIIIAVDTSGSMDERILQLCFNEIVTLAANTKKADIELMIYHIDTVVRGKPDKITSKNWKQMLESIQVKGRGGTDFTNGLIHMYEIEKKNRTWDQIDAILYFTDLYDSPPAKEMLPAKKMPPIVFLCPPGHSRKEFRQSVSSFARVIEINPTTIDLGRIEKEIKRGVSNDSEEPAYAQASP